MPEPLLGFLVGAGALALTGWLFWPKAGLVPRWRARRELSRHVLQEDALKHLAQRELEGQPTTLQDVSLALGLSGRQAASLIDDLQIAGYLTLVGEASQLTAAGREEASRIIRAHRLWERHLAEETGFAESEWHELAERQEHRLTPAETEALARALGQPARDPHGDPIPTADGELVLHEGLRLSTLVAGTKARITHVEDEPPEVYQAIAAAGLAPGVLLRLVEVTPDGVRLQANGDEHRLSPTMADNISAMPLPSEVEVEAPGDHLDSLRPGEQGRVVGLTPRCRGAERSRMFDLGILPGTVIEAVMTSPGGDPTAYRIRDALIALRREQAGLIRISRSMERNS